MSLLLRYVVKLLCSLRLPQLARDGGTGYRPERHYMRGPGPQWHAKHGSLASVAVQKSASQSPRVRDADL